MDKIAFNIGFADGVEKTAARDMPSFLRQDRPESVKKIYRALKKDHPGMPAAMKARIAARHGRPGKQHQGPPYAAPLTEKTSGVIGKGALVAGTLAVPYVVGKNVRSQQNDQTMNKQSSFDIGMADGIYKSAAAGVDDLLGGVVGHRSGKAQKESGEKYVFGPLQAASLILPGGIGYQAGRYVAHHTEPVKKKATKKK